MIVIVGIFPSYYQVNVKLTFKMLQKKIELFWIPLTGLEQINCNKKTEDIYYLPLTLQEEEV